MPSWNRTRKGNIARSALLMGIAVGALACFPQAEGAPQKRLTVAALDAVDTALTQLAEGRWPEWSMRVEGDRLAFEVDVAQTPVAAVCREIGAAVRRSLGDTVEWSAELTRGGTFLSRCGTWELAKSAPARRRG